MERGGLKPEKNSYLWGTVHVYATSYVSTALLLWGRLKAPSGKEELCN